MPSFSIIKEISPQKTFRVASIMGRYDLKSNNIKEHFQGELPIETDDWQIGAIIGNSGTGKTTIAKEIFGDKYIYKYEYKAESILDDFGDHKIEEIAKTLNAVGFSSPPSWLKPYHVLSNGEKMRVDLAKALLSDTDPIIFDEFTSVVDRNIGKVASFAIAKTIRRTKRKFVAISCHYDILEWLCPDWTFDCNTMTYEKKNGKDPLSTSKYMNVLGDIGKHLGNITI